MPCRFVFGAGGSQGTALGSEASRKGFTELVVAHMFLEPGGRLLFPEFCSLKESQEINRSSVRSSGSRPAFKRIGDTAAVLKLEGTRPAPMEELTTSTMMLAKVKGDILCHQV